MFIEITERTKGPLGAPVFRVRKYVITIPGVNKEIKWETIKNNSAPGIWIVFFSLAIFSVGILFVTALVSPVAEKIVQQWILVGFTVFLAIAVLLIGHNVLNKS